MFLSTLEPRLVRALSIDATADPVSPASHLLWYVDGLLLFFLISWFSTSVLPLDNDFYYAIFIWTALTFLYKYVRLTNTDVLFWFRTRWRSSLFLGGLTSIYVVMYVWDANPTTRPSGWLLAFELVWRGLAYGIVDALVLTGFPVAIGIGMLRNNVTGLVRRSVFAALTLVLVWIMSTAYHVGFAQFEGDLVAPQLAPAAISIPALVSVNPLGSVVAQTVLHVSVTFRTFESDLLVPPAVDHVPDYEPPGVFGPR